MSGFGEPNGMGGSPYNGGTDTKGVKSVIVRAGSYVDAVKFVYKSGKESQSFGGCGGTSNTFNVDPDDHIVQINVWQGCGTDALQFITKSGEISPKVGGTGGGLKVYKASSGQALVGFHGRSGTLVDKFVPVFDLIPALPQKTSEKIIKSWAEGRSSIAASLSQMERGISEGQKEDFEAHWEKMATSFEGQIANLKLVANVIAEADKNAENQMMHSEKKRVDSAQKVKQHQESVANFSSEVKRDQENIRQCEKDIEDEEAIVEDKKKELRKKKKEREQAAASVVPLVGLGLFIFGKGKPENIIPGVGAIKTAISAIEQDVERAQKQLSTSNQRATALRHKKMTTMQMLDNAREKLTEANRMVERAESDRDRWEKRKNAMGRHLTEVRQMKINVELVMMESKLIRENKIANVKAWLDYSEQPKMFDRKKRNLLKKLDEISKTLTSLLGKLETRA